MSIEQSLERAFAIAEAAPQLNMNNYTEEQVRALNDAMIELYLVLRSAQPSDHS